jgi:hypothetical protein
MRQVLHLTLIAALLVSTAALAQKPQAAPQAPTPPQLSPKAAYDDAMHPLEATRHAIANWSETEVDALKVAIARAAIDCAARDPKTFSGDPLVDLARLCALGQSWPAVVQTTTLYISAEAPAKPLLSEAYSAQIDALLHIKDEPSALASALAMLKAVPYDAASAEIVDEAVDYMQFANTADALTLDAARQPLILAQIRAAADLSSPPDPEGGKRVGGEVDRPAASLAASPTPGAPPQSLHELYADGVAYAALQQLADQPAAAADTIKQLDAAMPVTLTPDDGIPIAAARKRYAFLGQRLPKITMLESLSMPNRLPELPAPGAMTALLLFPDWCAQCVRLGPQLPQSVVLVEGREAYFYGLMAETAPPQPKPVKDAPPAKSTPRDILAETPTVVVPPTVLSQFAADDFPFLIIVDAHGVIRVLQPVDEDSLAPGGTIDTAIARVGATWPIKPPQTPVPPATSKP